jgi:hypothetical protein
MTFATASCQVANPNRLPRSWAMMSLGVRGADPTGVLRDGGIPVG